MIRISWSALIGLALAILLLPLKWLLCALLAAVIHESAHILTLLLLGGRVSGVDIGIGGTVIDGWLPDRKAELISILAGPAGSFLLFPFRNVLPELSVCACIQGLFNILPAYPLDGGRVLRILLSGCTGNVFKAAQMTGTSLILICVAVSVYRFHKMAVFPILSVIVFILLINTPCKEEKIRLQ